MYLAENLKFLREQNGKTQGELAVLFGIEQKTISSWECGSRKPPIGTIVSCNLDPGEKCDCESLKIEHQETSRFFYSQFLRADDSNGQMSFVFDHPQGGAIGA